MKKMIAAGWILFAPFMADAIEAVNADVNDMQIQTVEARKTRREKTRRDEEKKTKKRGPVGPMGPTGPSITSSGYVHQYSQTEQAVTGPSNVVNSILFDVAGATDAAWQYDPVTGELSNEEAGLYLVQYRANVTGPAGQNTLPPSYLPEGPTGIGPSFEFVATLDGVNVPGSHAGITLQGSDKSVNQSVATSFILDYPGDAALSIVWAPSYGPDGVYSITPVNYSGNEQPVSAELTIIHIK